jgi:hypothetical protein
LRLIATGSQAVVIATLTGFTGPQSRELPIKL